MKKLLVAALVLVSAAFKTQTDSLATPMDSLAQEMALDSIERGFKFDHGTVQLKNGVAKIVVPEGFKFLDAPQSEHVLYDLWGNPRSAGGTYGLILPEDKKLTRHGGYVFVVQYDEIG